MAKEKSTERRAKDIVEEFIKTGDLTGFLYSAFDASHRLGKYSHRNRELFETALIKELRMNLSRELFDLVVSKIAQEEFEK